jgi:acyl-CoA thioesterase
LLAVTRHDLIAGLLERDRYAALLGISLAEVTEDTVTVTMPLTDDHENFYDVAHGGAVFSVADCAFSLASNAHGDKAVAVDTHLAITAASSAGDTLTATAEEMTRGRTLATYRVTVTRGDDRVCGLFTGTVAVLE